MQLHVWPGHPIQHCIFSDLCVSDHAADSWNYLKRGGRELVASLEGGADEVLGLPCAVTLVGTCR